MQILLAVATAVFFVVKVAGALYDVRADARAAESCQQRHAAELVARGMAGRVHGFGDAFQHSRDSVGPASRRVIAIEGAVVSAGPVVVDDGPVWTWRGRVRPRTPGPAARAERGDIDGFAPPSGRLLRRLPDRQSRPGTRESVDRFSALGAPVLHVRGLRVHVRHRTHRGGSFRPSAPPTAGQETTNHRQARRMIGNTAEMATIHWGAVS